MAKNKASVVAGKAKPAAVAKPGRKLRPLGADCCAKRYGLIRWAELVESLTAFEDLLRQAADDEVLDDVSIGNIEDCLRCLKGELSSGVPIDW